MIKSNAYVIGTRETVKGFALIGVEGKEVPNAEEAFKELHNALSQGYNLIILSASVVTGLDEELFELRKKHLTPIVIVSDLNTSVNPREMEERFKSLLGI
ncbi:MAG: V-type ATP synthase subunit F [Candidatus Heimdallarchaeaceae archaeon]